jgi:site-specific recombinase XerD
VQQMLGHASISTTQIYQQVGQSESKSAKRQKVLAEIES